MNEYARQLTVAQAEPSERAAFIRRTYAHLAEAPIKIPPHVSFVT